MCISVKANARFAVRHFPKELFVFARETQGDQAIPGHLARERQRADEALLWQRRQVRELGLKAVDGALLGGGVYSHVQVVGLEASQLAMQIQKRSERAASDELLLQVEEGPLDLALGLGAVRLARSGLHAIVPAQLEELRVPPELIGVGIGDQRSCAIDLLCPTGLCGREPNPELASSAGG